MVRYPERESISLEFKEEIPEKQQIIKTVIGFSNMYGGKLIVGIADDLEVIGVSEEEIEPTIESLRKSIFENCTPTIMPQVYSQRYENKLLIVIEISKGSNKPYYMKHKGIDQGTYIRYGAETLLATPEMIDELKDQSKGIYPDERPVYKASKNDLNIGSFEEFLRRRLKRETIFDPDDMLMHYNLIKEEHHELYPTVAGLMLFGKDPQRLVSESFVIGTHFSGTEGRDVLATQDFTGSLFEQYQSCYNFITSRLNKEFEIPSSGIRKEWLEIPEEAIREVLLNALVHRHHGMPSPGKISIYDDRVEIFSPGGFPGPIQHNTFLLGLTYLRNPVIARVFREQGLIEKMGSGLQTLFLSYEKKQLPRPILREGVGFVKCILPRPLPRQRELIAIGLDALKIIRLFYMKKTIHIQDVQQELGASRSKSVHLLNALIEAKFIERTGKGKHTSYLRCF